MRAGLLFDLPHLERVFPQMTPWNIDRYTPAEIELRLMMIGRA